MRKSVIMFCGVSLSLFFCCGLFFNRSCVASAEVSGGRFLTPAETMEFYGNSIPCTYYNGSEFVTVNLQPTSLEYVYHFGSDTSRYQVTDYISSSTQWVMYYSGTITDYVSNPNYINLDIRPNLTAFGVTDFYAAIATRCSTQGGSSQSSQPYVSASAYDNSFFDISANAQTLRFSNSTLVTSDNTRYLCPCMTRDGLSSYWSCLYVPVEWHTSVSSTVSTLRAGFYGATKSSGSSSSGRFEVYLACPYINPIDAEIEQGVVTTAPPSSGGDINVTVNVDLSPLETALQNVGSDVQGIANDVSGIGSLLVVDSPETIARLDLEPIDTLPTLDYHKVIDDVDAVLDDIPSAVAGTASIWGIIGSLFTSDSVWMWLVPFCVFMCLASFVLWRR